jgi:hypothetical protein
MSIYSLNVQIEDVQQRLLNRQRIIDSRTTILASKIKQQMMTPATLLLAGGIGFILGELTKKCRSDTHSDQPQASEISPLKIALNLLASARRLYPLLSLAWMMQSRYQPIPEQQMRATSTK